MQHACLADAEKCKESIHKEIKTNEPIFPKERTAKPLQLLQNQEKSGIIIALPDCC